MILALPLPPTNDARSDAFVGLCNPETCVGMVEKLIEVTKSSCCKS